MPNNEPTYSVLSMKVLIFAVMDIKKRYKTSGRRKFLSYDTNRGLQFAVNETDHVSSILIIYVYVHYPGYHGFSSRWRRDTSVSATGRQIFGIRPKIPETGLEKSMVPKVKNTCALNPLSSNSNQHQVSHNNIHTLSREMVMRINQTIAKEKML